MKEAFSVHPQHKFQVHSNAVATDIVLCAQKVLDKLFWVFFHQVCYLMQKQCFSGITEDLFCSECQRGSPRPQSSYCQKCRMFCGTACLVILSSLVT